MRQNAPLAPNFTTPPDAEVIAALAERAVAAIPARLRAHISNLGISVEDLAEDAVLGVVRLRVWPSPRVGRALRAR